MYYDAAVGCSQYQDPKSCQVLANLCVLQLYGPKTTICSFYQSQVALLQTSSQVVNSFYEDKNWVDPYPWLYYDSTRNVLS